MKRTLLIFLFFPFIANAQIFEASLGGGYVFHNYVPSAVPGTVAGLIPDKNTSYAGTLNGKQGYSGHIGVSVRLSGKFRLGLNVSSNRLQQTYHYDLVLPRVTYPFEYRIYTDPVVFEIATIMRNKFGKLNIDIGIAGGICGHKREQLVSRVGYGYSETRYFTDPWYTYGITAGLGYSISKHWAIGVDANPKILSAKFGVVNEKIMLLPVIAKMTVRI